MSQPATLHEEEALGKAYDRRLMRRLLTYVRPYRALVAGALICLGLEGVLQLVGPLLTQRVIDVALPRHDISIVRSSALLFVVALLVSGIPIFSITQIFGGVAIKNIVTSFLIAAATAEGFLNQKPTNK